MVVAGSIAIHRYYKYQVRINEIKAEFDRLDALNRPTRLSKSYRRVFTIAEDDLLPWLMNHSHPSVAIQSAWEAVERGGPNQKNANGTYQPNEQALKRFFAVLKERTDAPIPIWWKDLVLGSQKFQPNLASNLRYNIRNHNFKPNTSPYHQTNIHGVRCPKNASFGVADENHFSYAVGDQTALIPRPMLPTSDSGRLWMQVSGCFHRDRFFYVLHHNAGFPHMVSRLNLKQDQLVWESQACGCVWNGASGRHTCCVELTATDDHVFVFGAASMGFYFHAFDAETGETVAHFSSNY